MLAKMLKCCQTCIKLNRNVSPKISQLLDKAQRNCTTFNGFKIPKRIERGPTDILKALSNVIERSSSVVSHEYIDDPKAEPYNFAQRTNLSASEVSGRRAAKWIVDQNSALFQHKNAAPDIKAFRPTRVYSKEQNVTEETLLDALRDRQITAAIEFYHSLGKNVSDETKQLMLEFSCFYNNTNPEMERLAYVLPDKDDSSQKNGLLNIADKWEESGFAELLFQEMGKECKPEAYCAIIQGRLKHGNIESGWELFEQCKENNIPLNTKTYNKILATAGLKIHGDALIEFIMKLLPDIDRPDLDTLNSILESFSDKKNYEFQSQIVSEFMQLGIEPSVGTYSYFLQNKPLGVKRKVLTEFLPVLMKQDLEIRHPSDMQFFPNAVWACHELQSTSLAWDLYKLSKKGSNYKLIGKNTGRFYFNLFRTLMESGTVEEIMELYDEVVPGFWNLSPSYFENLVKLILSSGSIEYLPKLYTSAKCFPIIKPQPRPAYIEALSQVQPQMGPLREEFAAIAKEELKAVVAKIDIADRQKSPSQWLQMAVILSHIWNLLTRNKDIESATEVFNLFNTHRNEIPAKETECVPKFLQLCVELKNKDLAMECFKYAYATETTDFDSLAALLIDNLILTAKEKQFVENTANQAKIGRKSGFGYRRQDEEDEDMSSSCSSSSSSDDDDDETYDALKELKKMKDEENKK